MLGSATCAYSGAGPIDPRVRQSGQNWSTPLRIIADCLTIPISTNHISDIRDVVLLVAAGTALLFLSFGLRKNQSLIRVDRNVVKLCAAVFLLACISAFANSRFELSRGWIARFVAGAVWAGLIATHLTIDRARMLVRLLLGLGGLTLALAIVHRGERGLAHFSWPIGPITITAAMAGLWACIAIVWLVVRIRRARALGDVAIAAIVAAISLYCLWETGRRSAALGLVAGLVAAAFVYLWVSFETRRARIAIIGGVLTLAIAAIGYVANQATSTTREKSGPVALRLAYWRESASLIREHPVLGIGPDCFIVDMTNRIAPLRAVSPHFYHGTIDPYAHNEWLQAIVEMGIPGGLAYIALPIFALLLASRSVRDPARRDIALVSIAGLAAICVNDFGSINLRESILPIWYWTLLGVATADPRLVRKTSETPEPLPWTRGIPIGIGFAMMIWAGFDLHLSQLQALKSPDVSARLYSRKTLAVRVETARMDLAGGPAPPHESEFFTSLCITWSELNALVPGYPNVTSSYVDCLFRSGERDRAVMVLSEALSNRRDQFDPATNLLYESVVAYPVDKLRCVQRSLRSGALDGRLQEILLQVSTAPAVQDALASELPEARRLAVQKSSDEFAGATIELLRINASIKEQSGATAEAIGDQRLAAECYQRLERTDSLYRRRSEAEVDAFYSLARMIYEHDRVNYRQAYDAIREAERYAVLGIGHEWVAKREPERGFVIGEVMPTEFPARLRPMWHLSALLHLVQGDDGDLDYRVNFSLPPSDWTEQAMSRELAQLGRTAYDDLGKIPENLRPAHYRLLPDMIRRYDAKATAPTAPPIK
jgi:O-antigen ligase